MVHWTGGGQQWGFGQFVAYLLASPSSTPAHSPILTKPRTSNQPLPNGRYYYYNALIARLFNDRNKFAELMSVNGRGTNLIKD